MIIAVWFRGRRECCIVVMGKVVGAGWGWAVGVVDTVSGREADFQLTKHFFRGRAACLVEFLAS